MFCLIFLLGHIVLVTELMARPSTRMATHGASTSLRVLLARYGTLHRADTPKSEITRGYTRRAWGVLNTSSLSYLSAWKISIKIAPNTSIPTPRCLILLEVKSPFHIYYLLHGAESFLRS